MMNSFVRKLAEYALYSAPKGIQYYKLASGSSIESANEVDFVPVPHGADIPGHIHQRSNALVLVLSGSGFVELDEQRTRIERFDVINIPAGTYHAFQALPDKELTFLSVQYPPIGGDYVFSRTTGRKSPSVAAYMTAGALTASMLLNVHLSDRNRYLGTELEEQRIIRAVERDPYTQGIERGMIEYHGRLEKLFGAEAKEIERQAPYPII